MKNIHEDVEWSLVNAVPANSETYLSHGGLQSLLGDVLLCHGHLGDYEDFMIYQTERYIHRTKNLANKAIDFLNITTK